MKKVLLTPPTTVQRCRDRRPAGWLGFVNGPSAGGQEDELYVYATWTLGWGGGGKDY